MKNILNAVIDEARNLVVTPSEGFAGEHNAEVIEIDIGPFAADNYDYFILNFENFCADGKLISNVIRTENDEPSYIANGVICCPLTAQLTASGRLRLQLEAHKNTDSGEIVKKSSVAELSFKPSVMGEQDMMNSGGSIYSRLEALEDGIEDAENRVRAIESQNYGAKINAVDEKAQSANSNAQGAHAKADALDGRVDILETESVKIKSRIETVESYKIPESFDEIENRVKALEDEPDALQTVPLATSTKVGGFLLSSISPVQLNEDGEIVLSYDNINHYSLAIMLILALLYKMGEVETFISETIENLAGPVYDGSMNVLMDVHRAIVFAAMDRGTVEYVKNYFENVSLDVEPNHIYVMKKTDDTVQVDEYFGDDLRRLILEGI